ncbi:MAG: DNRLRE domain-containing protein [Planctomycetota bacterium]
MRFKTGIGAAVAAGGCVSAGASAGTFSAEFAPSRDAVLYESATGSLANGSGDYLFAGRTLQGSGAIRRSTIGFDVSSIPAGSTITGVTLRLFMSRSLTTASVDIGVSRVTTNWREGAADPGGNEGGGTAPLPGDVTWTGTGLADNPLWNTPGGDFFPAPSAVQSVGGIDFYQWFNDGLIQDVQAWVDGTADNFGWMLTGIDESILGSAKRFNSRNSFEEGEQPVLIVNYIPTPGAASAMALFGLTAFRRRR